MNKLTVILPAAGKGQRLNLPYPKEILRINESKALIDNSFELFDGKNRDEVEFVIIINEKKTEIIKYLSKYKDKFNISFTFQNPDEFEYTGAIKSAKHLFGDDNIVLLPDTILTLPSGIDLFQEVKIKLNENKFAFLFKQEVEEKMLSTKGSLELDNELRVIDYEDKPTKNLSRFHGYWCGFAFKKEVFDASISFMEQSTLKIQKPTKKINQTSIFNSKVIKVEDFKDLGTWKEIGKILSDHSSNE